MISCIKPVIRKNESKEEFIVFHDDNGAELLIPVGNIDDIFSNCRFHVYKNGRRDYYEYRADSMIIDLIDYYGHNRGCSYNLCFTVNRSEIKRIISETKTEYVNLQSEINKSLDNERNLINKDSFLDDGRKKELVNKLKYKSCLPDATTHLEDIKKCLVQNTNTKATLENIKEVISSDQSGERELLTLLRTMLSGDK